ncbi:DUF6369 family protein [Pseudomonas boanensis]|uniref:DUF6369 family protein n=1 Tax=Metapseudomonas boanensis TaxID=2822138 RepID=UPI0035D41005
MIYIILSLSFFSLGLLREKGAAPFILAIACLPFANSLSGYFYKFGLYSYDFFFIGALLSFLSKQIISGSLNLKIQKWALLLFATLLAYAATAAAAGAKLDVYFLRDLRPAIFALELVTAAIIIKNSEKILTAKTAIHIVILAGFTNLIWLALSIAGIISSDDEYYTTNNYKYFDSSTYISALFAIYFLSQRKARGRTQFNDPLRGIEIVAFLTSLISVVFSGYRALILATAIAALASSVKDPRKLFLAIATLPACAIAFIYLSTLFGADRVIEGLTIDGIFAQLSTRYGPAFDVISAFTPTNYLFGAGFGTVFEIDWFGYRSLDTTNNFVDSAYVTFFAKYGLMGILMLVAMVFSFRSISPTSLRTPISAYLFVLFMVYAISYQPASAGIIVGCILLRTLNTHLARQKDEKLVRLQN